MVSRLRKAGRASGPARPTVCRISAGFRAPRTGLSPSAITGPNDDIVWDPTETAQVDYEVELGVVMGRRASRVSREHAFEYVFGYTVLNDVSASMRDDPLVKDVSNELVDIEKLVSFPPGKAPSPDDVRKVNEAVGKVMEQIQHKDEAKK